MKITIEPTDKIVTLMTKQGAEMPARVWEGKTDRGTPVHCFITRISPSVPEPIPAKVEAEFRKELEEKPRPCSIEGIPLRLIL